MLPRPVECLVVVPFKTIVEIRFKAAIVVVLKRTIENQESDYNRGQARPSASAVRLKVENGYRSTTMS